MSLQVVQAHVCVCVCGVDVFVCAKIQYVGVWQVTMQVRSACSRAM